jgi:predicted nucleotidyltransferase
MNDTPSRIVGLFSANLAQELTINQIKHKLRRSYHFIYDATQELIKQNILNAAVRGHSTVCSLNLKSEKTKALLIFHSINKHEQFLNKKQQLTSLFGELIRNVVGSRDILSIILFGSYAKGTETKQSDIDLLIIAAEKDKNNIIQREIHALETTHGKEINQMVVTASMFKTMLRNKTELNVGKEALANHVVLYGPEFFWKFVLEAKNE